MAKWRGMQALCASVRLKRTFKKLPSRSLWSVFVPPLFAVAAKEASLLLHGASLVCLDPSCIVSFLLPSLCLEIYMLQSHSFTWYNVHAFQLEMNRLKRVITISYTATITYTKVAYQVRCVAPMLIHTCTLLGAWCLCFGRRRHKPKIHHSILKDKIKSVSFLWSS